ncbi:glycosyltransferase [Maridesulfovibrio hydrothermalis]|uniref:Glycosyl transferase 2 family protein n=1 Tax=Maridesulfovibrio hydrothermalis AM13 = DSM 14728 TaxID=1121451 RepID=L0RAP5_9BACT|nr:glycosyltransferase [Maridesulfovibrio hydrothermalis]CCO22641.1 Glycosyl transferase 2 family protein [Maridesulfovibrio hydrothermalis AM13 = DSM 14728]
MQDKTILEGAVSKLTGTGKVPKNLLKAVVNFLKYEGESDFLAKWVMESQLAEGKILPPHTGKPKVSFIVPCYNHGEYLRDCVVSLLKQDYTAFEIIIINDGSTDNTDEVAVKIIEEFPDYSIRYIKQKNSGLVRSRNKGCTVAKGKYILPIDADDLIAPSFLSKTIAILESSPQFGYVSTKALFFGHSNLIWPKESLTPVNFISTNQQTCTTLFRKDMWKEIGGYDESMIHGYEDWELWIRATKNGWVGLQIDEPLFFYRRKADSMITNSRDRDTSIKEQIVRLHPDIYDISKLPLFEKEMHYSNWIPPQLVRPDFRIHPCHMPHETVGNENNNAEQDINNQLNELKKHILGILAQIVPQSKDQFLRNEAGSGDENKFEQLYTKISSRIAKFNKTGNFDEAVNVGAILLSLYPIKKTAVLLLMDSLLKKGDLAAAYSTGSFYLSVWLWDKAILKTLSNILCLQADSEGQSDKTMGLLESAILLSPDSRLALTKTFEFQISNGLLSAADRTRTLAEKHGIKLPAAPLRNNDKSFPRKRKHIWYVTDTFGYIGGGVNGVSQAKFMTLGSLLSNDDLCDVTIITPLTTELPSGIAEFSRQYHMLRNKKDAAWPNWITTVKKELHSHLGKDKQNFISGDWLPCREPENKADLIIIEGVRFDPDRYLQQLGLTFNCPSVYMHHNSPYHYSAEITEKGSLPVMLNTLKRYKFNISVSRTVTEEWKSLPEQKDKEWFNILNCIREDEAAEVKSRPPEIVRQRLGLPKNDFLILCLASIQHRKGQDLLLNQMDKILESVPSARVIFIGPVLGNRGGNDIVEMSKGKPYSGRIRFLGTKENALDYVYASNLLVLPSREEALPLSILEAMALGRACVASDVCGIPELIEDGETGLMFSLDNPQDLAKHIIRLAQNPDELETMSKKAESRYWDNFSREQHARRWREVLMEIFGMDD